jgi:hypothetical protein
MCKTAKKRCGILVGLQGVSTILYMRPEQGFALALLVNLEGLVTPPRTSPLIELARSIAGIVLRD